MSKNIVLCADGTGNAVIKGRGTNVFKTFEAVDIHGHRLHPERDLTRQVAFYTDGVGTAGGKVHRLVTGALGSGLAFNVKSLYMDLVRSYQPGDRIYLFGFSRGSFTVRTLSGFINACGVMKLDAVEGDQSRLAALTDEAYRYYVAQDPARLQRWMTAVFGDRASRSIEDVKANHAHFPVPIRFIGVWDTVAALGFPVEPLANWWNRNVVRFKFKRTLIPRSEAPGAPPVCARHALAIDDARTTFHPTMWTERDDDDVLQVWFAGMHSNVGGGYPKQGMSLVTLSWMMQEAELAGLRFIPESRELYRTAQNVHDMMYDSREGVRAYYRYGPRDVRAICDYFGARVRVHESVVERIYFGTQGYAPVSLPDSFDVVPYERGAELAAQVQAVVRCTESDPDRRPLLHGARWSVRLRKVAYWGMFGLTIAILVEALDDLRRATGPGLMVGWGTVLGAAPREGTGLVAQVRGKFGTLVEQVARGLEWLLEPTNVQAAIVEFIPSVALLVVIAAVWYRIGLLGKSTMSRYLGQRWFARVARARAGASWLEVAGSEEGDAP